MTQPQGAYVRPDADPLAQLTGGYTDPSSIVWDRPADRVRNAADAEYTRIRNDKRLSPQQSQARLAKTYLAAKSQMDATAANATGQHAADLAAAKRSAYGIGDLTAGSTPAEVAAMQMNFRDAAARASQLTSVQAASHALQQADATGDELLARAIGNHAQQMGFSDVANDYLSARPAIADAVAKVNTLTSHTTNASDIFEFTTPQPSELSRFTAVQLGQLADLAP